MLSVSNNNSFALQDNSKTKGGVIINSLFHLIQDLVQEENPIIEKYKKHKKGERDVYFLDIVALPNTLIFSKDGFEYVADSRHLSIDKIYTERDKGFTCAHYTEKHKNLQTKKERVVHVYFDTQGRIDSVQVRELPDTVLSIDSRLRERIKENSLIGLRLLNTLLEIRRSRYSKIVEEANFLERRLDELSLNLYLPAVRREYEAVAVKFCKNIDNLNRYNTKEHDKRGLAVAQILKILKSDDLEFVVEEESKIELAQNEPVVDLMPFSIERKPNFKTTEKKKKSNKTVVQKKIISGLLRLEKKLDNLLEKRTEIDAINLVSLYEIKYKINTLLISLMCLSEACISVEQKTIKDRVENKLKIIPDLNLKLTDYFIRGDIENFKYLFELIRNKLDFTSYNTFIVNVSQEKDEIRLKNKLIILQYLFENSEHYRSSLLKFSPMVRFSPSEEGSKNHWGYNYLVEACFYNNINVFNLLLEQGCSPNTLGMQLGFYGENCSVLKGVIFCTNDSQFVESLLANECLVDSKLSLQREELEVLDVEEMLKALVLQAKRARIKDKNPASIRVPEDNNMIAFEFKMQSNGHIKDLTLASQSEVNRSVKNNALFQKKESYTTEEQQFIDNIVGAGWALLSACKMKHYRLIPLLCDKTELIGVAMSVAYILNHRTEFSIEISTNLKQEKTVSVFYEITNPFVKLWTNLNNIAVGEEFAPVKTLCHHFQKICAEDPKAILEAVGDLEKKITNEKDYQKKWDYMYAAFLLWAQKNDVSPMESQSMIQTLYGLGGLCDKIPGKEKWGRMYYEIGVEIARKRTLVSLSSENIQSRPLLHQYPQSTLNSTSLDVAIPPAGHHPLVKNEIKP